MDYIYKVIDVHPEDPMLSTIEKQGITANFTARDIEQDIASLEKMKKELTAQSGLEKAKIANIVRTDPEVEDLTERQRHAAYLYQNSYGFLVKADEKIDEINEAIAELEEEKLEITKQTGIIINQEKETPMNEETVVAEPTEEVIAEPAVADTEAPAEEVASEEVAA